MKPIFDLTPILENSACFMTPEERTKLVTHLRVAWGETNKALVIAAGRKDQWPELAKELDQMLTRLTRHLTLAEMIHLKGGGQ